MKEEGPGSRWRQHALREWATLRLSLLVPLTTFEAYALCSILYLLRIVQAYARLAFVKVPATQSECEGCRWLNSPEHSKESRPKQHMERAKQFRLQSDSSIHTQAPYSSPQCSSLRCTIPTRQRMGRNGATWWGRLTRIVLIAMPSAPVDSVQELRPRLWWKH